MKALSFLVALSLLSFVPVQAVEKEKEMKTGGAAVIEKHVVAAGTYKGTAHKIDAKEKEIFFKTDDGKLLELHLKGKTELTKEGKHVDFDSLKAGQKLEVHVEKHGERLSPLSVKIME